MSENSPGLPPSPEGHFALGSLFLSLALRVEGKLMCATNEREKDERTRGVKKKASRLTPDFDLMCINLLCFYENNGI